MLTREGTASAQQICAPTENGSYQVGVMFMGTFVFVLRTDPADPDSITHVDVYAPDCGHTYSAGLKGLWNDPFRDPTNKISRASDGKAETPLLMLEPRRHCLELYGRTPRTMSLKSLKDKIAGNNLWPKTKRAVALGWDLLISVPVPDDWCTESTDATGCFSGADSGLFTQMGMVQTLTYCGVYSFKLLGSPLPISQPNTACTLIINAEPACIPSMEHQRRAGGALAGVMGLDLRLEKPLGIAQGQESAENAQSGSCMGSAIMEALPQ
jgi:hypothetical protein